MTDVIIVETSDHARLTLKMSYRWMFKVDKEDTESCNKAFMVKDFVGDTCKRLSSRIRGAVSSVNFDNFHKNSADIITSAIFKKDKENNILPFII